MLNTNITQFRKNVFAMIENTIKYNEPINISTKSGNAILLSEEESNGIMATLELSSNAESVSYTHLDVYKRQDKDYF